MGFASARQTMRPQIRLAVFAMVLLAGCAGDGPADPSPSPTPSSPAPTPIASPTSSSTPAQPTGPTSPTPTVPTPVRNELASAEGYVAPVFETQDAVAAAADPASFADVNPIDYRNPWR